MYHKNKWLIGVGSLLVLGASTLVLFVKRREQEEKPPKKAPQLHIENPGSQAEFFVAPGESELG